jgi:hypothetical protein
LGSTGWLKSLITGATAITQSFVSVVANRSAANPGPSIRPATKVPAAGRRPGMKTEFAWDANYLYYTVREPFPTKTTGTSLVFGRITTETPLILESRMAENGVIFSDGIEKDFLEFNSGTQAVISIADRKGILVE